MSIAHRAQGGTSYRPSGPVATKQLIFLEMFPQRRSSITLNPESRLFFQRAGARLGQDGVFADLVLIGDDVHSAEAYFNFCEGLGMSPHFKALASFRNASTEMEEMLNRLNAHVAKGNVASSFFESQDQRKQKALSALKAEVTMLGRDPVAAIDNFIGSVNTLCVILHRYRLRAMIGHLLDAEMPELWHTTTGVPQHGEVGIAEMRLKDPDLGEIPPTQWSIARMRYLY